MIEHAQERALANHLRAHALMGQLPEDVKRAREIVALFTAFAAEAGLLPRPSLALVSSRAKDSSPPPQGIMSLTRSRQPQG
jgi:hypothetical protein